MKVVLVKLLVVLCFTGLFGARNSTAANFTVVNTLDAGPGSLRQAIADAEANSEADFIGFDIPASDLGYDPKTGVWTIQLLSGLVVTHSVTIDGYTQPGAQENTQPVGQGLNTILKIVLHFNSPQESIGLFFYYYYQPSSVRGLVFNGSLAPTGSLVACGNAGHVFTGNFFGTDATGKEAQGDGSAQTSAGSGISSASAMIVGGTRPEDRNLFAGRSMIGVVGSHATIQGNLFGTSKDGLAAQHLASALEIDWHNQVGGTAPGAGNVIVSDGDFFTIINPPGSPPANHGYNVLEGNFIGTDVTGTVPLGSRTAGVLLQSDGNRIGGGSADQGNVISGNALGAIKIASQSNVIQGNFIGTQADGTSPLPNSYGILIEAGFFRAASGNLVGSPVGKGGNKIAFNNGTGVIVANSDQNAIYRNEIHDNAGLGIDLGNNGVTPNDAGDTDSGSNGLQNFPVITQAHVAGGVLRIAGTLNGVPNRSYHIECFGNSVANPSGFGQGQYFLAATSASVDQTGYGVFGVDLPYQAGVQSVSVTATDPDGNTSEFSAAFQIGVRSQNLNLSTRLRVETGERVLIGGFIVTGADPKRIIVRAIGPSLASVGVQGALADPVLELYNQHGDLVAANDNWRSDQQSAIEATGIPPSSDLEAAIVVTLPATNSAFTAIVRGKDSGTGVALVEAYDLDPASDSKLGNISSRGFVGTGDSAMIGGFIIGGGGGGGARILIRGLGPSTGINGALADPTLELRDADGAIVGANNDWKENEAEIRETGVPPVNDLESALAKTLPPSSYTVILRGNNNTAGVGLVEIYNLQ
jgi:hypothetical protein